MGESATELKAGDRVRLVSVPDWLTHDLPENEQRAIRAQVGKVMEVTEVDGHGYIWLGFGNTTTTETQSNYEGHSFAVSKECVERCG